MQQLRKNLSLATLVLFFFAVESSPSAASPLYPKCAQLYLAAANGSRNYINDVKDSNGLRLILKDVPQKQVRTSMGGLFREPSKEQGAFSKAFSYIPRKITKALFAEELTFTPAQALHEIIFDTPVKYLSNKVSGHQKILTHLLTVPLGLLMTFEVYMPFQQFITQKAYDYRIESQVNANKNEYDSLIQSDYRFKSIADQEHAGQLTQHQAEREAFFLNLAFQKYYSYMNSSYQSENEMKSVNALKNHLLFQHLNRLMTNGVYPTEGFYVPVEKIGPLSDQEKIDLFRSTYRLYMKYQIILDHFKNGNDETDPTLNEIEKKIELDPFVQTLLLLKQQGKINQEMLIYRIEEDAYWQSKFEQWKIAGVTRLKMDENNQWTTQPLTIEDIRAETINELTKN